MKKIFNRVWVKEEFSSRLRVGIVRPIPKGRISDRVESYRGL